MGAQLAKKKKPTVRRGPKISESGKLRRELFVKTYIASFNASEAARAAGIPKKNAARIGFRYLHEPETQAAIKALLTKKSKRYEAKRENVIREYSTVAFSDIGDYVDWGQGSVTITEKGKLKPRSRRALAEIKEVYHAEGGANITVKMHDKLKALDSLARYLGMFDEAPGGRDQDGVPQGPNASTDTWTEEVIGTDNVTKEVLGEWMDKYLDKPRAKSG